jgi:hypothetical protein
MLDLLIVAFAQFVTKVNVQQSVLAYCRLERVPGVKASRFPDIWHMKVVRLSALHTVHLYSPGNIRGAHFFQGLS